MKTCYPIILTEFDDKSGYLVYVPDFDINTSGTDLANALEMARDVKLFRIISANADG